ncbi:Alanine dehydrogenase 2 [Capnocytophaga canimorsus Cc5]|uniref:Alanine dehydrogenase n=1 Tax=Capnocytophaga canimorsus (strain 5) TaxID=860228 RepID=F9YW10_CAPCC|nr:alanine dehydrogenase [Capnocytophaga canimorsus]AEK24513.1 Alanine dehydrogenase 2 [Capnocytophaga canimorsus Cc5]GIM59700.1 alanine dehydrogenase [Capnocytophaga canimorsus]
MIIGIPKEIKNNENRVGATPAGVKELIKNGHTVYVQKSAGIGSGFSDEEYQKAGATILPTIEAVYAQSEMIYKVKEPIATEYELIKENQLIFTYFHFASEEALTHAMIKQKAVCLAYETVEANHSLPLLTPMSEVAGRMAAQQGARFLEKPQGGKGILMGGVPGVKPAKVLVLGGGVVGYNAAITAAGLGAEVIIADISLPKLRYLDSILPKNIKTLYASQYNIEKELPTCDLVIGAVLIPGAKAPALITREMLKLMTKGSVLVDVAIDQGGCFETSRVTTHSQPIYEVDGIVHYCVANIPGAVPFTSTLALTNATLPYAVSLANNGWKKACQFDKGLAAGLNVVQGKVTYKAVAETFHLEYTPVETFLK